MSFSNLLGKSQLSMYVCFGTCIPNSLLTQNFSLKKKIVYNLIIVNLQVSISCNLNEIDSCA